MRTHGVEFDLDDKRTIGTEIAAQFVGTLTPVQQEVAAVLLAHELGMLVAPPGVGKTVIGTYLVAIRRRSALILVHRGPLLDQWRSQLAMFLDIEPKLIGQIGGNRTEIDPVAAIGLERWCAPAWHIEVSGLNTKHAAS
jgi:superfamily II DNA or RNA helicase